MNEEYNNQVELDTENSENETQRIYYAPPYQQEYYSDNGNSSVGWGVTALILGIVALLSTCCCACGNIIPGILGLIFGIVAIAKKSGKGMGIAGLIMSIIAILSGIVLFIFVIVTGEVTADEFDSYNYDDYNYDDYAEEYFDEYNRIYGDEFDEEMNGYMEQLFGDQYTEEA